MNWIFILLLCSVQTVISRVFLGVNRSSNERMTLGELRKSDFMDILHSLDGEDDINKVNSVLNCRFSSVGSCALLLPSDPRLFFIRTLLRSLCKILGT